VEGTFDAHFSPQRYSRGQYWGNTLRYWLITALFNRLNGAHRVWHRTKIFPRRSRVDVSIGSPLWLEGESYPALARKLETQLHR
jgi:hypothetical protein